MLGNRPRTKVGCAILVLFGIGATGLYLTRPTPETRLGRRFDQNRQVYEKAADWVMGGTLDDGWLNLPKELSKGMKSKSALLLGERGNRILLFEAEDDGETVLYIGYTEKPNLAIQSHPLSTSQSYAMWTVKKLAPHWQVSEIMP